MELDARGKFLFLGEKKYYPKSIYVTGPEQLYAEAAEAGANAVWLAEPNAQRLDFFATRGLKVIAQLGFEGALQQLFAGDKHAIKTWLNNATKLVQELRQHPALVAYDLSTPVQEPIRRWLGSNELKHQLWRVFREIKKVDPNKLITCTAEAACEIKLTFLDFLTFNVDEPALSDFRQAIARLQIRAGDKPLIVQSVGADSSRGGQDNQAYEIDQQIRMAFIAGCAGFTLRTWSDSSNGSKYLGIIDVLGGKKESFSAAAAALRDSPFPVWLSYPKASVVICVYNGEGDIEECLDGVAKLDYPDFEVIILNDGSTDRTLELAELKAKQYGFRVVSHFPNRGLSAARNRGLNEANGEIVAYLDSDAFPDRDWLRYLAINFLSTRHAIIGGPNINPLSCGPKVDCIDQAPGNPQIVMADDEQADHIPGCNLAVRRSFLKAIGGFDEHYRGGGDDVNLCWKVRKFGATAGVSPGAMVWHYRRPTIRGYLRQQISYGKGEAALEKDWPNRFNSLGHQMGPKSGPGLVSPADSLRARQTRPRVYQKGLSFGGPSINQWLKVLPAMPEWPMITFIYVLLAALGLVWREFLVFMPFAAIGFFVWVAQAIHEAVNVQLRFPALKSRILVGFLCLVQPILRLYGRVSKAMAPWRSRCDEIAPIIPQSKIFRCFSHSQFTEEQAIQIFSKILQKNRLPLVQGDSTHGWDWQLEGGALAGIRLLINADSTQVVLRAWPYLGQMTYLIIGIILSAAIVSIHARASLPLAAFVTLFIILAERCFRQAGEAMATLEQLLVSERDRRPSLWERFQPPRHFFVELALPQDAPLIGEQNVALKYQLSLQGCDLHQDGDADPMELVFDNS